MPSIFEWVIITAIIVGIGYVGFIQARRGGQANPVSTRKLESELRTLSGKVGAMGGTVTDLKGDVKALGAKVDQVERESVTRDDIDALKELLIARQEKRDAVINETSETVKVIRNWLLEKGLGGH